MAYNDVKVRMALYNLIGRRWRHNDSDAVPLLAQNNRLMTLPPLGFIGYEFKCVFISKSPIVTIKYTFSAFLHSKA